jgi:hypothetical protein
MCGHISRMVRSILLAVSAMIFAPAVFGIGSGWGRRLVRAFGKHMFNPFMLRVAARRHTYYAVLHHVGRRSGGVYVTPVVAKLTPTACSSRCPTAPVQTGVAMYSLRVVAR